jgi:hypothetical protein
MSVAVPHETSVTGCWLTVWPDVTILPAGGHFSRARPTAIRSRRSPARRHGEHQQLPSLAPICAPLSPGRGKVQRHRLSGESSICVVSSGNGKWNQVSFVNGLWVPEGNHIRHMRSQIASFLAD